MPKREISRKGKSLLDVVEVQVQAAEPYRRRLGLIYRALGKAKVDPYELGLDDDEFWTWAADYIAALRDMATQATRRTLAMAELIREVPGQFRTLARKKNALIARQAERLEDARARIEALEARRPDALMGEAKALALLVQHPNWSDKQIAKAVPCNRTTLYDWPKFKAARQAKKEGFRRELPRGSKTAEGDMEAWDETEQPTDETEQPTPDALADTRKRRCP